MYNDKDERFYVKFHFKTKQGIQNFTNDKAVDMKSQAPDHSQRDLFESIEKGDFPKWTLKIQIMPFENDKTYHLNPFDLTKV
ncbi:hypothetical protein GCM10008119_10840 [Pedobacter mendelii]|uniref:catalase n=1 Tax=Pedobacter mendelii TaxID=1908240 RepID=A0ABQ2BIA4_9SPHI|nr:hypothetical protein GCM10008119_10840 [Pedobacter mendelii]